MKELNYVEVIVEKEKYAREGVHNCVHSYKAKRPYYCHRISI